MRFHLPQADSTICRGRGDRAGMADRVRHRQRRHPRRTRRAKLRFPLCCLLPRGVDRLIVAGRYISGNHVAHSYRVMPIAMATGHAAGVCAALATRTGKLPQDVPADEVQQELRAQGASLRDGVGA